MNFVNKNSTINIYYKSNNLVSGLSVIYNIIGDDGIYYALNTAATAEIDSKGIYYLDFSSPNKDLYLLCKAGLSSGIDNRAIIIKCGEPSAEKIFYVDENFQGGKTIAYQIFDLLGDTIQSGNLLDEFNTGFYSTDVTSLDNGTYFLKVDPYISKFNIPLQTDSGEAVVTTEIRYVTVNVATSKGGASKARHSIFDYEGEMTKRRIEAKLEHDNSMKGALVYLRKDEDEPYQNEKTKQWFQNTKSQQQYFWNQENKPKEPKKGDFVPGTNIVNG